ncbi:MAG: pitrilysin family protein [Patescibacteria group bacterium]|jgi:predicted Zn-dependent peptidase
MYKKQTLKNGIRLITAPLHDTQTASLLVLFKVGSRQETPQLRGVSHFIEHMMFKGTDRRPTTLDLSKELDGIGAEYNAFTGKDMTGYYIKSDARHLPLAIDMLSDMVINSKFDAVELEKEKGVIVEEINMYEDNPLMHVEEMLEELVFDGGQLGHLIAGSKKTVRGLDRKKLLAYKRNYYNGANVVIGLAGKFSDKQIKEISAKFSLPGGKKSAIKRSIIKQQKPRIKIKDKATEQVQLALGFPAWSTHDKRVPALNLLAIILGGNMSSRLFINIREQKGLAYFIRSWPNLYEDTGLLVIQAGLDKARLELALEAIILEIKSILAGGVTAEELNRAKEFVAGKTALDLEDSMSIAQFYVNQELMNKPLMTPEQKLKKIFAVSAKEVQRVAKDIFDFKRVNLALIGPGLNADKLRRLIK